MEGYVAQRHWVSDYAPNLLALVVSHKVSSCTITDGLAGEWLRDYGLDLGHAVVVESFHMWHVLANIQLALERKDEFVWRWSGGGSLSASLVYRVFFANMVGAPMASQIWWSWAPYSCKCFVWLISMN
jgi:hypothetical protein